MTKKTLFFYERTPSSLFPHSGLSSVRIAVFFVFFCLFQNSSHSPGGTFAPAVLLECENKLLKWIMDGAQVVATRTRLPPKKEDKRTYFWPTCVIP